MDSSPFTHDVTSIPVVGERVG
ncbi:hypothetical protein AERO8C_160097 [Aeromonas veronii]|uniref:Uncharacterized protein n=1 Tax=Aeromonas veronii TaxID=654 RepID=A0A653KXQ2_AERVE|nr:hypothetical protein AERO8C_160097 [Aeromonas veronii]